MVITLLEWHNHNYIFSGGFRVARVNLKEYKRLNVAVVIKMYRKIFLALNFILHFTKYGNP